MEKPLSLKREDFLNSIIGLVNESGLPHCVVLEVMKGVTAEIAQLAQRQYEADKAAYEKALAEEKQEVKEE